MCQNSKVPLKHLVASFLTALDTLPESAKWILQLDPDTLMSTVPIPEMLHIVVVGGPTGKSDLVRNIGAPTVTREISTTA